MIADHLKKCRTPLSECKICLNAVEALQKVAPHTLSGLLQDRIAPKMHNRLVGMALDSWINRTNHRSQRAKHDVVAGASLFRRFESLGGKVQEKDHRGYKASQSYLRTPRA